MADTVVSATGSVIFHVNDNDAAAAGNRFAVFKNSGADVVFRVQEDGAVVLTGELRRGAGLVFENSDTSSSLVARFRKDSTARLELRFNGTQTIFETPAASDTNVQFSAGDDTLILIPDFDDDASPNYLKVIQSGGADRWVLGDDLTTKWYYSSGNSQADYASVGNDVTLTIGNNAGIQGYLWLQAESYGTNRAARFALCRENGSPCFLGGESSGVLRIHTADPEDDSTLGSSVGSQT